MSLPLNRIITAVDFSPPSLRALGYGIALALRFEAQFYLFHSLFGPQDTLHNVDPRRRPQSIARQKQETLERMQEVMNSAPVAWQPLICTGPPVETIARETARLEADLVVAAGQALSVMQKLFLGRVVDPMARTLTCPLLIIRDSDHTPLDLARPAGFKKIVIACELKSPEDPVAATGAYLAGAYGAETHLLHALTAPLDASAVNPAGAPYTEVQEALYRQRLEALRSLMPPEIRKSCAVQPSVHPGPPAEVLEAYCRKVRPDLIVVGVRRRGRVKNLVVGSTTQALLHQRIAHLLTVPLKDRSGGSFRKQQYGV